jgi:BMFP domain-containing protein YqiC
MQTRSRFFEDLARVASGAASTAAGIKEEVEGLIHQRIERALARMDVVPREEFEAVREMAAKARAEQEKLSARIAALESLLAEKDGTGPKPTTE